MLIRDRSTLRLRELRPVLLAELVLDCFRPDVLPVLLDLVRLFAGMTVHLTLQRQSSHAISNPLQVIPIGDNARRYVRHFCC